MPSVSYSFHYLDNGHKGKTLPYDLSELLREIDVSRQGFLRLVLGICRLLRACIISILPMLWVKLNLYRLG